jgi:hypothetical protein
VGVALSPIPIIAVVLMLGTPKARSNGLATVAAMVSVLAPVKLACTEMVGKLTCGKGATGSKP